MPTTARHYLSIFLLALCGYIGNVLAIPITFGVSFIFGSIFAIVAAAGFGSGVGLAVSLFASSYTYQLWNHPYAIIVFACEIVWVAHFLERGRRNLLFIDLSYWLIVGAPLVFIFYGAVMQLGMQNAMLITLKQSVNGILNAVLAWTLISVLRTYPQQWIPLEKRTMSSSHMILQLATLLLLIPSLGILLLISQRDVKNAQKNVAQSLRADAVITAMALTRWVNNHILAVTEAGQAVSGDNALIPSPRLQEKLAAIHTLFPDFHLIFIGDRNARTIAFQPPHNENGHSMIGLSFADRAYFQKLKDTLQTTVSNVFVGRGGIFQPTFTISVPVVRDGKLSHFGLGAIKLEKLSQLLKESVTGSHICFTLSDKNHTVIASTQSHITPMHQEKLYTEASKLDIGDNVQLLVPGRQNKISSMRAYRGAYYVTQIPITNTPWHLSVEYSVASLQHHHYQGAIWGLSSILCLLLFVAALTHYLGRRFTASLSSLGRVTVDLPQQIENHRTIPWPAANIEEVAQLIDNFKTAAASLAGNFSQIREINAHLEETIATRTGELQNERKRLSNVLSERNIILDNATVGISLVRNRVQIWENKALRTLFGYSSEQMHYLPTRQYYRNEEEYQRLGREAYRAFAAGLSYHTDIVMCRADGSEVIVSLYGKAIDNKKIHEGSIWIFDDITERKEMELALKQSETRFRQLFHVASTPLFYVRLDGKTLALNSKFTEVLGYNKTDIPTIDDWVEKAFPDPEYRQSAITRWQEARKKADLTQVDLEEEYRITCKSGEERFMLVGGSAMEENFLATFIDITDIKKANIALETAKEAAEAANKTKSTFLSNMSHELRTPLNAILGFTQIFQSDTSLSTKQQQGIQTIHKAAEHLLMIINDVLDMSKIEAGKLRLVEDSVAIMPFLENVIDSFTNAARKKNLDLSLIADPAQLPRAIVTDSLRLRQIIFNFMSNSVKFTEKGYCYLKVGAVPVEQNRYRITLTVEDSGPGIPKERQNDIFIAFRQIEEHLQHESGTGLGLSICKQLVELMHGGLRLESPVNLEPKDGEGPGSRFTVVFEADAGEQKESPAPSKQERKISYTMTRDNQEPLNILVVDDNRSNRMVLREILEPIGLVVTEAKDGSEVTEKCLANRPHLILMDLRMPGIDGFTALEQLTFHEELQKIPVIAITASLFDSGNLRERCLQHGFKDFMQKPFTIEDLLHKLAALLPIAFTVTGEELQQTSESAALLLPPKEELSKLRKLLAEGNLDSIMHAAETIATLQDHKFAAYAALVQQAAGDFDFARLETLISKEENL